MLTMNETEYKKFHESYMQNNHGSTALHTFFCIFFTVQCSIICAITKKSSNFIQYFYEYVLMILSMVVIHTVLFEHVILLNLIALAFLFLHIRGRYNLDQLYKSNNSDKNVRLNSITTLRALTYLITGLCILAVDFKDFPRNLAKTENYGYSLMDTGVGLFVLMSGLVHQPVPKPSNTFVAAYILLFLGIARFVSVTHLDYHENVNEYGVHWNFFVTLALCKILSSLLLLLSNNAMFLSITVVITHECLLYAGLQEWVFGSTKRENFLDANKEGISSVLGYIALYLFAAHLKSVFSDKKINKYAILKKCIFYSLTLIFISYFINILRPISRTLANAGYCAYLSTLLTIIFSILYFIEIIASNNQLRFEVPLILDAINYNGLLFFLACNISTGIVNVYTQTLFMSSLPTFILLNVYMIFNVAIIVYLKKRNIKVY